MPTTLYHYTSREAGQAILVSRQIQPSSDGFVYLTPDTYDVGYEAADRLSILGGPCEVVIAVTLDDEDVSPKRVEPERINGELVRSGHGAEVPLQDAVHLADSDMTAVYQLKVP